MVVPNQPPTVTSITSGNLTGTATDGDGTISGYLWTVNDTSAVTITTGNAAILQYTASQVASDTAVTFTLTVTDDDGATGSDTYDVTVTDVVVPNQPPTVTSITGASSINEGASGNLTGTATDGDGTISGYLWTVNDTSAVTITTGNAAILQYTASQVASDTAVTFTLTVTDDDGATGSDTYDVTVTDVVVPNQPPTVTSITGASSINEGASGNLTGTATDGDGTISGYLWTVNDTSAVTITTGNAAILQYTASQVASDTAVTFTLTVTDDDGATGSDTYDVTVTDVVVPNQLPTVNAGDDQDVAEGSTVSLNGTAFDTDPEDELEYAWMHNSTLTIPLVNSTALDTSFTAPNVAEDTPVEFTLAVSDGTVTVSDKVIVTIQDGTNALPSITIQGDNPFYVTVGIAYSDPGATCADAEDGSLSADTASGVDTQVAGTYPVTYTCTDSFNNTATAIRTVHVTPVPEGSFVTTWQATANDTITIPVGGMTGNYTVHWGDGSVTTHVTDAVHTYAAAGNYTVSISGDFTRIQLGFLDDRDNAQKLVSINQWGSTEWATMEEAFLWAGNMSYNATDEPDLSGVSSMLHMFAGALSFNGNLSGWNVSSVTHMDNMFNGARDFNGDISAWDVSGVTDMNRMFWGAPMFNSDISAWNVSSVTGMTSMFAATSFNGDISSWDVSSVTDMSGMFSGSAFNGDISDWDVSEVTRMNRMFHGAHMFNSDISGWNVSSVTDMTSMFDGATLFRQNLGAWYVVPEDTTYALSDGTLNATTISAQNQVLDGHAPNYGVGAGGSSGLFNMTGSTLFFKSAPPAAGTYTVNVTAFGGDFGVGNHRILDIEVTGAKPPVVESPGDPFVTVWETTAANQTITIPTEGSYMIDWGDGTVNATASGTQVHTYADAGNYTVAITGGLERINLYESPSREKLVSLNQWGDIEWTSMDNAFRDAANMAYNATDVPNLSGVSSMQRMFAGASDFNGNLSGWDVSGVFYMREMFAQATSFDGDISTWDVSGVTNMLLMFGNAEAFNGDISGWDVSSAFNMNAMFFQASAFNGNISGWDVSSVTRMTSMFDSASAFNGNISGWDVSSVTDMASMFDGASAFNGNISGWDVSSVTGMASMFDGASRFNSDISSWDVSSVTDMASMFAAAPSFNADLSGWSVSGVTDMASMFDGASAFNGNISGWNVSSVTDMTSMFDGATLFRQNLGAWYVVPEDTTYALSEVTLNVTTISAQNQVLDGHAPSYGVGAGGSSGLFNMTGSTLFFKSAPPAAGTYTVNVTAFGGDFGVGNHRILDIEVTVVEPPVVEPPVVEPPGDPFVTVWKTTAANHTITIPVGGMTGNYTVHWGDNSTTTHVTDAVHTYAAAGNYTVSISGDFTRIQLGFLDDRDNAQKLVSINQWGSTEWATMEEAFLWAGNMSYNATDEPDLSGVSSMLHMFAGALSFNGNLSGWNVSSVTHMDNMFNGARDFNGDISAWDVSGVTDMNRMFWGAPMFNSDISAWNVSSVTGMTSMFAATSFNGDISSWDVSSVTDMSGMFSGSAFNGDISDWDVSEVTRMNRMFHGAHMFNSDISGWNVSSVTDMTSMFDGATLFRQNLGAWYVVPEDTTYALSDGTLNATTISAQNQVLDGHAPSYGVGAGGSSGLFYMTGSTLFFKSAPPAAGTYTVNVTAFGGDFGVGNHRILDIEVTGAKPPVVESPGDPFVTVWETTAANQTITIPTEGSYMIDWGDGTVNATASGTQVHTYADAGNYTVAITGGLERINLYESPSREKLVSLNQWGDIEWTSMDSAFRDAANMAYNATDVPNLSGVSSMHRMFAGASDFNGNLSGWDVSGVFYMREMFAQATSFDGDISTWDVSGVTNMLLMFGNAEAFNGNISGWDVSSAFNMNAMFFQASAFNGDISGWDVSSVTRMTSMFDSALAFDQNLGPWYIVLGNTSIDLAEPGTAVGAISAQNAVLDGHNPAYGIGAGSDSDKFQIINGSLHVKTGVDYTKKAAFSVNITSTGDFGTNNHRVYDTITVDNANIPPVLDAIPSKTASEGQLITFSATATDVNGDPLTFSFAGTPPGDAAITAGGVFTWRPGEEHDGNYTVTVRVSDGQGGTASQDVAITVNEANQPPTADAGVYDPHGEGVLITLDGSASTDDDVISGTPDSLSYLWRQIGSGDTVAISGATTPAPAFTSPTVHQNTTLTFELTVTDGAGESSKDTATILIVDDVNERPVARAGPDATYREGGIGVVLDGSASSDVNPHDTLSYLWSQTGGTPAVTLSGATASRATFATPVVASDLSLTFTLNVTDSRGGWHADETVITIRDELSNAPIAVITGGNRNANEGVAVTLEGSSSSDPNGDSLTYAWNQTGGTPVVALSSNNDTASFTTPIVKQPTPLTFTLIVYDGTESDSASVVVTVLDNESDDPVASATGPQEADEGATVTLDGSTSTDPNPGDRESLVFSWEPPQGVTLSDPSAESQTFVAPQVFRPADYTFTLTVRDTDGNAGQDTVTVRVLNSVNEAPAAVAAGPQNAEEDATVTLDGSASSDPNGDGLEYSWTYLTGTPVLTLLGSNTSALTFVAPHVKGPVDLEFGLTVTDTHGDSGYATATVTLLDTLSNIPVSVPGPDQTVGEGAPVTLDGSGSYDPNGDPLSYLWTQAAGPGVVLSDLGSAITTFRAPAVSVDTTLEFSLTVTDVDGNHTGTVAVDVQNLLTNNPVARPRVLGTVGEGVLITLDGSGSYDPHGDPITHAWTQVSGPPVMLSGAETETATFQAPRVADPVVLVFELAVTDGITTGTERLSVTIPDDRNDPPVLQGIDPQQVRETDTLSFTANATDVDGNDLSFSLAGAPPGASMDRDTGMFVWTPDQSQDGIHTFNVTVRDGDGGSDHEDVQVTVLDIAPLPVSARASSDSITLTLSEAVTSSGAGPNGFSISARGDPVSIESVTGSGTTFLTLSANGTVPRGATLSYDSSSGDVADETGKALDSFDDLAISFPSKSRSTAQPPVILVPLPPGADPEPGRPLQAVTTDDASAFPLVIDGNGYTLHSRVSTLVPTVVTAGQPVTISVTLRDPTLIAYFAIYLYLQDDEISHLQSDAQVIWSLDGVRVIDPNGLMRNVTMTVSEDPADPAKKTFTLTVTFSESMGETNMVIRTWNSDGQITEVRLFGALVVTLLVDPEPGAETIIVDPEPGAETIIVDPEPREVQVDPEPVPTLDTTERDLLAIRMWSGFEPESISDAQLLAVLGLDYPGADIPGWVMTKLAPLVVKGGVTVGEFKTALSYVLDSA